MLRTFIFIVGVTAGGWILFKLYDAVIAIFDAKASASSAFTAPFVVIGSRRVWRKVIGVSADLFLSAIIYMFYGWTAGGQLGAGMASTLALGVSIGIYAILESGAARAHYEAKTAS